MVRQSAEKAAASYAWSTVVLYLLCFALLALLHGRKDQCEEKQKL